MKFLKYLGVMFRKVRSNLLGGKLGFEAVLSAKVIHKDTGEIVNLGVICRKVVTDAFVEFLVDKLVATGSINVFKYHDCGTGTTDEAASQTTLTTPFGGARVVGTQVEGATAEIYKTVATIEFGSAFAITEHAVFSAATNGTMMDRSKFAVINVSATIKIEFTYELTVNSGG